MRLSPSVTVLSLLLACASVSFAQTADRPANDSSQVIETTVATPTQETPVAQQAPARGAAITGLRAGVHVRETTRPAEITMAPAATRAGLGQARAMMVVGVAALISGAIIGGQAGTFIMVGGAVIGLVGLYDYLQ